MKVSLLDMKTKHPTVVDTSLGAYVMGGLTVDICPHSDLAEGGVLL